MFHKNENNVIKDQFIQTIFVDDRFKMFIE